MARPLGELARAALSLLHREPLTARQMSERLLVPERTIKDVCYRLRTSEHVRVIDWRRVCHARRPVAVYAPLDQSSPTLEDAWR